MSSVKSKPDSDELARLVKLCGLFSSDHQGERATAAAMADRKLRSHGLTWEDVFSRSVPSPRPKPRPQKADMLNRFGGWRMAARFCLDEAPLNDWEYWFCQTIFEWPNDRPGATNLSFLRRVIDNFRWDGNRIFRLRSAWGDAPKSCCGKS